MTKIRLGTLLPTYASLMLRKALTGFLAFAGLLAFNVGAVGCGAPTSGSEVHASQPIHAFAATNQWTPVSSGVSRDLNGVWASAPDDAWAVGQAGTLLHWNGKSWGPGDSLTTVRMHGVSGNAGEQVVWIVGEEPDQFSGPKMFHREAGRWTQEPFDSISTAVNTVWVGARNDVWMAGDGGQIFHWDGRSLLGDTVLTGGQYLGVWESQSAEAWAVGTAGIVVRETGPTHIDGVATIGNWMSAGQNLTTDTLYAIWGHSSTDLWVVGDRGWILHWDGSAWTQEGAGLTPNNLRGIWGTGSDVWAVGMRGTILHRNNGGWSKESADPPSNDLFGVGGSSASDVWAVGSGGEILKRHPPCDANAFAQ
jgi:hypothetical protein